MGKTAPPERSDEISAHGGDPLFLDRPGYLLLTIAATISLSEVLVMILLESLPALGSLEKTLLDGALLLLILFPTLYFLALKPLRLHIDRRRRAEEEKDALIAQLRRALDEVKTLRGIIPICASCKKIRDDEGFWHQVEAYVGAHSDALFSHGICPDCAKRLYPDFVKKMQGLSESDPSTKSQK
jgi:hypothetical protein